jgi:FkbM family methyltransferase
MTVFDVGANVGELTLLFARFTRPGTVHAFEPGSQAHSRLVKVTEAIGTKNVVLNHAAISDKDGDVQLNVYDEEHLSWNTLADRPLQDYGSHAKVVRQETVQSFTLDRYCNQAGLTQIDLLKLDVEGAELQCLQGARQLLQRRAIKCCVFEYGATTYDMGNHPDQIASLLNSHNYRLENVVPGDPVFPGGGNGRTAKFAIHVARPA